MLRGVDLDIEPGEMLAIVGASGSGKSTLLHMLGLLDAPDAGEVRFDGERIDDLPDRPRDELRNRTFGFIFQFYHLLPELTALENVMMPQLIGHGALVLLAERARGSGARPKAAGAGRAGSPADPLAVRALGRRDAARGDRPRVGRRARGPAGRRADRQPRRRHGQAVLELLRDLNRERGLTMILVTHDPHIARQADRVVRLAEGRIEEWSPAGLIGPGVGIGRSRARSWGGTVWLRFRDATPGRRTESMDPKVYINGKLFDKSDAKVSVFDHGLLYGDGVFEGSAPTRAGSSGSSSTSTGSTNRPRASTSRSR